MTHERGAHCGGSRSTDGGCGGSMDGDGGGCDSDRGMSNTRLAARANHAVAAELHTTCGIPKCWKRDKSADCVSIRGPLFHDRTGRNSAGELFRTKKTKNRSFTPTSRLTRTYTSTERAAVPSGGRQVVDDAPGTALRERGPRGRGGREHSPAQDLMYFITRRHV